MKKAALDVTIDYARNIIGRRKGKNPALKPICFGSHTDTVPNGGNYDGTVGSIGGLELIETLNETKALITTAAQPALWPMTRERAEPYILGKNNPY